MRNILIGFLLIITHFSSAQNSNHSFLTIPKELKENANAVIRLDETIIDMDSPYKMIEKEHLIVTVLNKYGDVDATISAYYDNDSNIKSIKANVYNAFGIEIKKIKSRDIKDYSASGGSLYSDNRVKNYSYIPIKYPYTIDYTIVKESNNTAFYPQWRPIHNYYTSTEFSRFVVNYPKDQLKLTVKENNLKDYNITNQSTEGQIDYSAKNLKAINVEPYSPSFEKFAPNLKLAPNKFNLAGVRGEVNNWVEFGQWMYSNLLSGRDKLSEKTKSEIKSLVKDIEDPIERARKVYAYMQDKTRYISVQVGIGGWKPMTASKVDEMKYGDCKALVNYTQALLKEANVNTFYTIINSSISKKDIDKDFVAMQGNHIILLLPTPKDTVWLECTTQKDPFGYMGYATIDRDVLVIKPDGGEIVHTKIYKNAENYQRSIGSYSIDGSGFLKGILNIESSGIQFDYHFPIADKTRDKVIKYYKSYFSAINNLAITKFSNETDIIKNTFNEHIQIEAENYGRKSGNRILITINAFNKNTYIPKRLTNRFLPIEVNNGYIDTDSITIKLPKSYSIEALPSNLKIDSDYGNYSATITQLNDSTITYKRTYIIKQGLYPKEDYDKFRKFKKDVARKDNSKIILLKNDL